MCKYSAKVCNCQREKLWEGSEFITVRIGVAWGGRASWSEVDEVEVRGSRSASQRSSEGVNGSICRAHSAASSNSGEMVVFFTKNRGYMVGLLCITIIMGHVSFLQQYCRNASVHRPSAFSLS